MELLAIGHALVIDANRKFWGVLARETGISVEVVCPRRWSSNLAREVTYEPNPATDAGLATVHPLPVRNRGNGSFFFFHPLKLWRLLRAKRYDVIYLNQETWALATLQLLALKRLSCNRRTPVVLCVAQNLRKDRLRFLHRYERLIARGLSEIFYCSEEVRDVLRWKGIRTPTFYFPLPFDDQVYRPRPPAISSPFRLGYLGRLSEDKGLRILLAALDELAREGEEIRLVVGGAGPLAAELQARGDVEFAGLVPHREAHTFYERIDCFVLSSLTTPHWKEQFGRVIVEAFGMGRPVIGSDSGAIPEVLGVLEWPWTYPERSPGDLARRIRDLRGHLATEAGRAALEKAVALNRRRFSQSALARTVGDRFRDLARR
jgi:glycosyltransferase involved in cell wall biosynthesis